MKTLKTVYQLVALVALINAVILLGGLGYAIATGKLTPERVRAMVDVLHTEETPAETVGDAVESDKAQQLAMATPPPVGSNSEEVIRRDLERQAMETEHRLILARRQMVEVERRREELEQAEAKRAELLDAEAAESAQLGFQKDLEYLAALNPKIAVDVLLAKEIDAAARLLVAMETRKGKKIIEAAQKDPRQRARMLEIQLRIPELKPEGIPAGSTGSPKGAPSE
jgi:hypothetical protein